MPSTPRRAAIWTRATRRVSDVDEQELIAAVVSHQLMSLINTEEAAAAFILIFLDEQ